VVPAINVDRNGDVIWIPDRESGDWIKSSPKKHSENATAVNKIQNGKFKPLVKLLKYWNGNLPSTANFKSFTIETMATHLFFKVAFASLEEGLTTFFDFVCSFNGKAKAYRWGDSYGMSLSFLARNIPDAAGTGSNTAASIDYERMMRFIENAVRSRDRMLEARSAMSVETACRRIAEAMRM
jgi:hypothetical protein